MFTKVKERVTLKSTGEFVLVLREVERDTPKGARSLYKECYFPPSLSAPKGRREFIRPSRLRFEEVPV